MKSTVANSNYYTGRVEIANKLDLFVKQNQTASTKAEENLQEFLEAFDGKVIFEKYDENSAIVKELGINSFPAFLINNKIKFSGVQSADKIKENFCQMNELDECGLELTESLV
jgi:protein-disulfide isomerase